MPLYEYQCKSCNKTFELLVTSTDDQKVQCPECSSKDVQKLLSASCVRTGDTAGLSSLTSSSGCGPSGSGFS